MEIGIWWGDKNLVGEFSWWWDGEQENFWLVGNFSLFIVPLGKTLQFGPNLDQNYQTLYLMFLSKDFFNLNISVTAEWQKWL